MIEIFENIVTLFITDFGLLGCLFAYIKIPKRKYFYFTLFFLFNFLSEYYWTLYTLILGTEPSPTSLPAFLGWDIGYIFLLLAVLNTKEQESKQYFHPLIFLPIPLNAYLFSLHIQEGGIINHIYKACITTVIVILCLQELFYARAQQNSKTAPHTASIVLIYLAAEYAAWTASCFSFAYTLLDPYFYAILLKVFLTIVFAFHIQKDEEEIPVSNWAEFRFKLFYQGVVSIIILILSVVGYFIATRADISNLSYEQTIYRLTRILCVISTTLVVLIILILRLVRQRYAISRNTQQRMTPTKRARTNIIFTISLSLVVLLGVNFYNIFFMYTSGIKDISENKNQTTAITSEEMVHYIGRATTALQSAAETVSYMQQNGSSIEDIRIYLTDQTKSFAMAPDNSFIGFYAYLNNTYIDGCGWEVPDDYDPRHRDWYLRAIQETQAPIIVPPYIDIEGNKPVITIAKNISSHLELADVDVVCLDINVEYLQQLLMQHVDKSDTALVINKYGDIIACSATEYISQNITDIYGQNIINTINNNHATTSINIDGIKYTLNVRPMLVDLKLIMLTDTNMMFAKTYAQITIAILAAMISMGLVLLIDYFNYRIEEYSVLKVNNLNNQMAEALARTIDAKDPYTNGHSTRVAKYSKMIATRAGFDEGRQENIYMMGLLHDIGKIGIPDSIINKTSSLDEKEMMLIQNHPITGDEILKSVTENPMLAQVARHHHERFDGTGYPDHLKGEDIPVEARIVAIADAYDAMTSSRSYRKIMSQDKVREQIKQGSGTQFDPKFTKIMLQMIDEDTYYSMREQNEIFERFTSSKYHIQTT